MAKTKAGKNIAAANEKVGGFLKEFKEFAMKGNVIDMAVGIIIGGAFGKIVSSLVSDIIMPLIGGLTGGFDFKNLVWHVKDAKEIANPVYEAVQKAGGDVSNIAPTNLVPAVDMNYGMFIQNFVDFVIIAFCIFLFIKAINSFKKKEEAAPAAPAPKPDNTVLLEEIRDLLKSKK